MKDSFEIWTEWVTYNNVLAEAHPGGVHAQDCGDAVVAGVVEELLPAIEWHVCVVVTLDDGAGVIHLDEPLCSGDGLVGEDVWVVESALRFRSADDVFLFLVSFSLEEEEKAESVTYYVRYVVVVVLNSSRGVLARAHDSNARQNWVGRKGFDDGAINVQAILEQENGRMTARNGWSDDLSHIWRDISHVLGSDHHEVKRLQGIIGDIRNLVEDWGGGGIW